MEAARWDGRRREDASRCSDISVDGSGKLGRWEGLDFSLEMRREVS